MSLKKKILIIVAITISIPIVFIGSVVAFPQLYFKGEELSSFKNDLRIIREGPVFLTKYFFKKNFIGRCKRPLIYSIGIIDNRFDMSKDEIIQLLKEAEDIWEKEVSIGLFAYNLDAKPDISVEFIYDSRQSQSQEVLEYNTRVANHDLSLNDYEKRLQNYNHRATQWNTNPGTDSELESFNLEKDCLDEEQVILYLEKTKLDAEKSILDAKGEEVGQEFEAARFNGLDRMSIYEYKDEETLKMLMAHEFGHALYMEHSNDPNSIMFHLIDAGKFQKKFELSIADVEALKKTCSIQ